ncbi:MAG: hypothetical protein EOM62_11960 [Bacteroidia bacterium]|jgi:hypothetical protein|nr:hypothetical protein [Bacteroidia bacterium]
MNALPKIRFQCADCDRLFESWEGDLEYLGPLLSGDILLRINSGCNFYVFVRTLATGFSISIAEWEVATNLPDFNDFHVILYTLMDLLGLVDGRTVATGLRIAYEQGFI